LANFWKVGIVKGIVYLDVAAQSAVDICTVKCETDMFLFLW